ncbi:MAG: DNA double-strand break repair nuclease NurA [Candidatus Bathyarchaeota archaeon]|nr:DNA double-strand break repair nuclease NurA [Candidatus Bathyarchaeota archaeon]
MQKNWHPLPEAREPFNGVYAVDSSSASRTLSNGIEFFIIRALMMGTDNFNEPELRFEMVKGSTDYNATVNFERILRDLIEIDIILNQLEKIAEHSIVLIDGNLYGRYTHLLQELNLKGWYHLPLELIVAMQRLFDVCLTRNIIPVGISKFSKTRVFTSALKGAAGYGVTSPEYLDVELLYRWKMGETGYTTPLLLGEYALEKAAQIRDPEKYLKSNFNRLEGTLRKNWATKIIEDFPTAPAIVMFHIIPKENAQPLRVDIPSCSLGIEEKIMNGKPFKFTDPTVVEDIASQIVTDFGGRNVYNALLYVVDREVRLGVRTVDKVYRSVLGKELGVPIEYDRSSRRFHE